MEFHVTSSGQGIEIRLVVNWRLFLPFQRIFGLKRRQQQHERTPGLHAGAYQVRDDFDDPLPEDFLITGS